MLSGTQFKALLSVSVQKWLLISAKGGCKEQVELIISCLPSLLFPSDH